METKHEVPLPAALVDELIPFWHASFGEGPVDIEREVFIGQEEDCSHGTLYLAREGDIVAGTCFTMHSRTAPELAGFGEVATDPRFRCRGIAGRLCGEAVSDFRDRGGQALFLGTGNPAAARVYQRQGWRKLAGAEVMVNISSGESPEAFLVDFFRPPAEVRIEPAGADVRVPMIALILVPHDDQVLDANVGLYSCRYTVQSSCMGLYPRYVRGLAEGRGAWWAARTEDGRVVGLASALLDGARRCQVDGFTHMYYAHVWAELLGAAGQWGSARGADQVGALVSVEDEAKLARFESLGFAEDGSGEEFEIGGRRVASRRLTRTP